MTLLKKKFLWLQRFKNGDRVPLERFHVVQTYFRMVEGEVGSRGQIQVYFENKKN